MWTQNQEGFLPEWLTTWLYFRIWTSSLYACMHGGVGFFINDNLCYKEWVLRIYSCCPPPWTMVGIWFSKKVLRRLEFFSFEGGGGVHMGDLPKKVVKWGGFNFKNLNCVLLLSFSQFSKIVFLCNTDCAFICLYYYIGALM